MNSRYNYKPPKKRDSSHDDEFKTYKYEEKLEVISTAKDGSVEKYRKKHFWKEEKNSWSEYIDSFDLGSTSDQLINHLRKGTPLVTDHVLPSGDYSKIQKGAEIKREMAEKGITFDMIVQAVKDQLAEKSNEKPVVNTGNNQQEGA